MAPICIINFNMYQITLSKRLAALAAFVGKGTVADIGTDHAQLPIWLVQNGRASALASDINEGPCQRARINIYKWGLHGKIKVKCCAGLDGIEEFSPDNIVIAGMGGELIESILKASEYPKKSRCRLVLAPQSMQDITRRYLYENGFFIEAENVVYDGGKYYQIISAVYTGVVGEQLLEYEYKLGVLNLKRAAQSPTDTDIGWLKSVASSAKRRIDGRAGACDDSDEQKNDRELLLAIEKILKGK